MEMNDGEWKFIRCKGFFFSCQVVPFPQFIFISLVDDIQLAKRRILTFPYYVLWWSVKWVELFNLQSKCIFLLSEMGRLHSRYLYSWSMVIHFFLVQLFGWKNINMSYPHHHLDQVSSS